MTPKYKLFHAIVLFIFSLLVAMTIAEIVCRYVLHIKPREISYLARPWAMPDPTLGWVNRSGVFPSSEGIKVQMGFWDNGRRASRAHPPSPEELNEKETIIIVGCSFTQGYGVRDNETFPWYLNQWNPHYVVENFGTGGYGTYQSLLRVKKEFETRKKLPKIVIYGFTWFHLDRNVGAYPWLRGISVSSGKRQELRMPYVRLNSEGQLQEHKAYTLPIWPLEERLSAVRLISDAYYERIHRVPTSQMFEATIKLLGEFKDYVESKGSKFVVANLCDFPETHFPRLLKENEIPYINCNPATGNWYSMRMDLRVKNENGTPGGHPSGEVHQYWAKCILNYINAKKM